jgi:hypothetical protein
MGRRSDIDTVDPLLKHERAVRTWYSEYNPSLGLALTIVVGNKVGIQFGNTIHGARGSLRGITKFELGDRGARTFHGRSPSEMGNSLLLGSQSHIRTRRVSTPSSPTIWTGWYTTGFWHRGQD